MERVVNNFVVNEQVIESLRARLNKMIADRGKDGLLHPDIIKLSQLLDCFISAYTEAAMSEQSTKKQIL